MRTRVFKCCFHNLHVAKRAKPFPRSWGSVAKISLRALVISAGVALLLMTAFSDLAPTRIEGFGNATAGEPVSIDCVVVRCDHSKTGLIVTAMDRMGVEARIYLRSAVMPEPVPVGTLLRIVVTPSEEDPHFMFASSVEVLSSGMALSSAQS